MKLKRFNIKRQSKKIRSKKNRSRNIVVATLILSALILIVSIMYFTLAAFTATNKVDVIHAKVAVFVHKVFLNADGGVVDPLYIEVKEKSLYEDLPNPTKNGYVFNGWYEGDVQVTPTTRMENRDTDVYLLAHWNIGTFQLNIDPDGGTWNSYTSIQHEELQYQEEKSINDPTREGYTFAGWEITGSESTYDENTKKIKMGYEETTLKAKWNINSYELTLDLDNDSEIRKYQLEYHEEKEIEDPEKEGYTFIGWDVSSFINDNIYIQPAHDVVMKAKWQVNDFDWIVYHKKMNTDGKNYTIVDTDTGTGNYGTTFTGTLRNYTDFVIPSLKSKKIVVDEDVPPSKNVINYEYKRNKHTLTINPNNGKYEDNETNTTDTLYYEATKELSIPTRNCYTFQDWSIDGEDSSIIDNVFKMGITDTTITANWLINNYIITFNANGGTIQSATKNVICGNSLVLPTADEVIKKGHTFLGWFTLDGKEVTNETIFTNNETLYAHWQANTYKITFDADGGTVSPETMDVVYDEEYGLLPEPIKEGHRFNGWYNNGSLVSDKTLMSDSDITLLAHYTKNKYKLTINPNGGTWNSYTSSHIEELEYHEEKEINNPTKEGYTFNSWNIVGSGYTYDSSNNIFKMGYSDATLKANWDINSYELTVDLDNGSDISKYQLNYHEEKDLIFPTKEGYTFSKWEIVEGDNSSVSGNTFKMGTSNTSIKAIWVVNDYNWIVYHNKMNTDGMSYTLADTETGQGNYGSKFSGKLKNYTDFVTPSKQTKKIEVDDTIPPTKNVINYNYTRNNHKLTINPNGGIYKESSSNTIENVFYEDTRTIAVPTRNCYTFDNWTLDGTDALLQDKVFKMGTSDATLTANWKINKYTVTFDPNGGTTTKPNQSVDCGGKVTLPTQDEVSKTGYSLVGWYTPLEIEVTNDTTYTKNTTVYAKWSINTYKISFNANEGSVDVSSKNVKYNDPYGTLPTPIRNGYTFNGWFNGDKQVSSETKMEANDITLTAHWTINTYNLSVNPNGGEWDTYTSTQTFDIVYNKTKEISDPIREGHTFVEWKKTGNGSSLVNKIFTMGYENATLTATWQINKYSLTVDLDNGSSNTTYNNIQYKGTKTLATPTKEGHTFSKWEIVEGDNAKINGSTFIMGTSNATIKAIWIVNNYDWVVYHNKMNTDGNNYTLADTDTGKGNYGDTFSGTLKNYTDFVTPKSQTKTIVEDTNPPSENIIDYDYSRNTHKLTVNPNGGTWNSKTTNSEFTMYYEATKTIADPTRNCYTFGSWTKEGAGSTLSNKVFKMGTANATLTANWNINTHVITFVPNGGTIKESLASQTKNCGDTLTLPTAEDISKNGYNFNGWYDNSSLSGNAITSITVSSNKIYYAKWIAKSITCSAGKYLPAESTTCTACPIGSYCEGGEFTYTGSEQGRKSCPTGYTSDQSTALENKCYIEVAAGKYKTAANVTTTDSCAQGSYSIKHKSNYGATDSCTKCPQGSYSAAGAGACTACTNGKTTSGEGKTSCDANCSNANGASTWVTASWSNNSVSNLCTINACTSGYTKSGNSCIANKYKCNAGQYLPANSTTCTACPIGSYCEGGEFTYTGSEQGKNTCPSGYTSAASADANTKCYIEVAAGKYKTTATGTTTNSCAAGTFKTKHNSYYNATDSCTACAQGSISTTGASTCSACTNGKTTSGTGKGSCDTNCSNATGVSTWVTASWSSNSVNSLCTINECSSGYTKSGNSCTANKYTCNAGQYLPANSTTCTACPSGSYCAGGEFNYNGNEQGKNNCPSGYTSDASAKTNTECYINVTGGKYKTTATGTTTNSCTAGTFKASHKSYYNSTDSCTSCVTGSYSAAGASTCTACTSGKTTSGTGKTSCDANCSNTTGVNAWTTATWNTNNTMSNSCTIDKCNAGYYKNGYSCTACAQGSYTNAAGATSCTACTNGKTTSGTGKTSCDANCSNTTGTSTWTTSTWNTDNTISNLCTIDKCNAGYYKNGYSCTACVTGSYSAAGATSCTACTNGKTTSGEGKTSCDANCSNATGASTWVTATWSNNTMSNLCKVNTCGTGYDKDTTNNKCTAKKITCTAGQYLPANSATCTACLTGSYCAGGTFTYTGSEQGRTGCPSGYTSDASAKANTECYINVADGKYKTTATGTTTNSCTAGTFKAAHKSYYNSTDSCTTCAQGSYSAAGAKVCTACTNGKTTSGKGKTSCDANCSNATGVSTWVAASWSSNSVSNLCKVDTCGTGYDKDTTNNKCVAKGITCSAGQYLPANSATCTDCPVNSYCEGGIFTYNGSEQGRKACSSLASGSYTTSPAKSSAATACYIPKANLSGKYVATANAEPVTCSKGGYCPGTTDVKYGSTGGRTACGAGKYNDSTGSNASSACKNITAGCYGTSATSACPASCVTGSYSAAGANACTACTNGKTTSGTGKTSCDANCSNTTGTSTWVTASWNSNNTMSNSCTIDKCGAGYYKNGYSCTACAQGSYTNAAGATSCTACTNGKTTSGTGKTSCDANCSNATGVSTWVSASWANNSLSNLCKVDTCGTGYDKDATNNKCTAKKITCSAGQYLPANSATCTDCPANSYCEGGTFTYNGSEQGRKACSSLASGSYTTSPAKSSAATACYIPKANLSGKYVATANAEPVTCSKGGYCPGTTDVKYGSTGGRTACGAGKYNDSTGSNASSACKNITAGCYGTSATSACPASCVTGSYSAAGASTCIACTNGKTTSGAGKTSCDANCSNTTGASTWVTATWSNNSVSNLCTINACASGYTKSDNSCTANKYTCSAGKYLPANSTTCTECPTGSYCAGGTFTYTGSEQGRTGCPSGYTSDASAKANTECYINVADGKYKTTATGTTTNSCTAGTFKAAHKSYYNSTDSCTTCVTGSYSAAGASACTACTNGKTTSGTGKTSCDANCSNTTGVNAWTTATWNTNNSMSNLCTINKCNAGYYKNGNSCTACAQGSYTNAAGATSCIACTNGKTTSGTGKTSCDTNCSNNSSFVNAWTTATWSSNSVSNLCTINSCNSGYTKDGNACKKQCAAGTYLPGSGTTCSNCTSGNYCAGGTWAYSTSNQGLTACSTLGTGYTSDGGANAKTNTSCYLTVTAGKRKTSATGAATENCAAGTFSVQHKSYYNSTDSCTACAKGSYTNAAGKSACTACTNGKTTSGTGKTSCDANCSNNANASTWVAASWSNNSVSNLCKLNACNSGYYVSSNACVRLTASDISYSTTYDSSITDVKKALDYLRDKLK